MTGWKIRKVQNRPQLAVMAGISSDGTERLQRVVDKALGIFPQSHSCCDRFESRNRGLQICGGQRYGKRGYVG
jgi:hypothetical protein